MKKLLSLILTITTLCSMAITVFADDTASAVTLSDNTKNYDTYFQWSIPRLNDVKTAILLMISRINVQFRLKRQKAFR